MEKIKHEWLLWILGFVLLWCMISYIYIGPVMQTGIQIKANLKESSIEMQVEGDKETVKELAIVFKDILNSFFVTVIILSVLLTIRVVYRNKINHK